MGHWGLTVHGALLSPGVRRRGRDRQSSNDAPFLGTSSHPDTTQLPAQSHLLTTHSGWWKETCHEKRQRLLSGNSRGYTSPGPGTGDKDRVSVYRTAVTALRLWTRVPRQPGHLWPSIPAAPLESPGSTSRCGVAGTSVPLHLRLDKPQVDFQRLHGSRRQTAPPPPSAHPPFLQWVIPKRRHFIGHGKMVIF